MAGETRRRLPFRAGLFVALVCLLGSPRDAGALLWELATIVSPTKLQMLDARPVEIAVDFRRGAWPETFQAELNGQPITALFEPTPTGVRALVDVEHGLRAVPLGSPGRGLNLLWIHVRGAGTLFETETQVFFVREAPVDVPSVVGMTLAEAQAALAAVDLVAGPVADVPRASIPTDTVVAQDPLPGTPLLRGSNVALERVAPPPPDVAIPSDWLGLWNMKLTYRDAATGAIDSVMTASNPICSADAVGVAALEATAAANPEVGFSDCSATATGDGIEISCSGEIDQPLCPVPVSAQVSLVRSGDLLTGSGVWTIGAPCGVPVASAGQTIEVVGRRASSDPGPACGGPPSSLLQKFMRNSLLIRLGGAL